VLVPASATTTRFAMLDVAETAHRAVLARLCLAGLSAPSTCEVLGSSGHNSVPQRHDGNATRADRSGSTLCLWSRVRSALMTAGMLLSNRPARRAHRPRAAGR
jgi:hypothetical protein